MEKRGKGSTLSPRPGRHAFTEVRPLETAGRA